MKANKVSVINHANGEMYDLLPLRGTANDAQKFHAFSWAICALRLLKGMDFTYERKIT
jgi:hypothetical protein